MCGFSSEASYEDIIKVATALTERERDEQTRGGSRHTEKPLAALCYSVHRYSILCSGLKATREILSLEWPLCGLNEEAEEQHCVFYAA